MAASVLAPSGASKTASQEADEKFSQIMDRYPTQGISASSFGKYNDFRKWLADKLSVTDWKKQTYATGAGTSAHNFGSRWSQSNQVAGKHIPLGIGFINVNEPDPAKHTESMNAVVGSAVDTSRKFVDGTRSTSFEAIIIFAQLNNQKSVTPHSILAFRSSPIGKKLHALFPTADYSELDRVHPVPSGSSTTPPPDLLLHKPTKSDDIDSSLVKSAVSDFAAANFICPVPLLQRTISALLAKPFLILAGLTGSGKTQLAIAVARWLSGVTAQRAVIAVGADWTSNQNLLGYPDALNDENYITTPALELMMRANANPTLPFFLILDEMNLSHVERYFSDLLSAIETNELIRLHGSETPKNKIEAAIPLPRNLFIIGTINVDETTYMFSPKVLDRANVVEFQVSRSAFANYLADPKGIDFSLIDGRGDRFSEAFVEMATTEPSALSGDEHVRYQAELMMFFDLFDREGFPFAFRAAKEIFRFTSIFKSVSGDSWLIENAIDAQVLQRLMPKLHGDRTRLKRLLMGLGVLCSAKHAWEAGSLNQKELLEAALRNANSLSDEVPKEWLALQRQEPSGAQLPLSFDKIVRMLSKLRRDGFTTFVEA